MKLRRRIWVLGLVIFVAGLGFWLADFGFVPKQPVYQGRRLGDWMVRLDSTNREVMFEAERAVTAMGTNAVPFLIQRLRSHAQHRALLLKWTPVLQKLHVYPAAATLTNTVYFHTGNFSINALIGAPGLGRIITDRVGGGQWMVLSSSVDSSMHGLVEVGKPAVPALLHVIEKSSSKELVSEAATILHFIEGPDYDQFLQDEGSKMPSGAWTKLSEAPVGTDLFSGVFRSTQWLQ